MPLHMLKDSLKRVRYDYHLRWLVIKWTFCIFVACFILWNFFLQIYVYQWIYGKKYDGELIIYNQDRMIDIPGQPVQRANIAGLDIDIELVKRFETVSRVIYVDRYSALGTWYRSDDGATLYDKIVPLDVSLATGYWGRHTECIPNPEHEYRCLLGFQNPPGCNGPNKERDISNNHIIPANKNVRRGLAILKAGDIAKLEGYLVYWQGTGKYSPYRFESAVSLGQISDQKYAGRKSILCRQLYLTKISFDGYTFE